MRKRLAKNSLLDMDVSSTIHAGQRWSQQLTSTVQDSFTYAQSKQIERTVNFDTVGQIWQFDFAVTTLCDDDIDLLTANIMVTLSGMLCCLPGFAKDPKDQTGDCIEGSPSLCNKIMC